MSDTKQNARLQLVFDEFMLGVELTEDKFYTVVTDLVTLNQARIIDVNFLEREIHFEFQYQDYMHGGMWLCIDDIRHFYMNEIDSDDEDLVTYAE